MGNSILGIGITGLNAAQIGLATTSHNIANASTPGYSRQVSIQGTQTAQATGSGFIGQGTLVATIRRQFNDFLNSQVVSAESQNSALQAFNSQISQINNLLADPAAGLTPALQDFFSAVQDVANDPGTLTSRQALLGAAQGLMSRFRVLDQQLSLLRTGVNQQITASVTEVNALAQEIASINERIEIAEAQVSQPANDLRDARDQLVLELNKRIGASVVQQGASYNVFIGNGVPIVLGNIASKLAAVNSPNDPGRTIVAVASGVGTVAVQESLLQGGTLGGMLAFRSNSLDSTQNALGQIAVGLAGTFNEQHLLGQDLNGVLGGNFFNIAPPVINANSTNTGTAVVSAAYTNYGALTASDYLVLYTGANYQVTRLSDSTQQTFAALPATIDGVTLTLASGAPAAGDQFLLQPTVGGSSGLTLAISDPARIAAAAPILATRGAANTGLATISAGVVNPPPPPNANLQQPVTITFTSPTTFNVVGVGTGNPVGVVLPANGSISYNGWTATITGAPVAGDTFSVGPNSGGVGDNRNALLLAALQTQNTLANGTATYQSAYSQLVSEVGNDTRQAQIGADAQQVFLDQAIQNQQALSGVNLDEEAANLIRYQQAYQASAKAIQVGATLFDELLSIIQ